MKLLVPNNAYGNVNFTIAQILNKNLEELSELSEVVLQFLSHSNDELPTAAYEEDLCNLSGIGHEQLCLLAVN